VKPKVLQIWPFFLLSWLAPGHAASAAPEKPSSQAPSAYPTQRFRFDAGAPLLAPAGVAPDGTICVGTADGYIHWLAPDGSYRGSYSVHGAVAHRPLFVGDLWYVVTSTERIYAFTRTGTLYWVFKPTSAIASELAADAAGLLYFVAADRFLYGITGHGGISVRAQFGEPKAGPVTGADGAVWAENQDGNVVRVRGQDVRRFGSEAASEVTFGVPDVLRDPAGRVWRGSERGVLTFSPSIEAPPISRELTPSPLLTPVWSAAGNYAVVSARSGLVIALDPPRSTPSR
jgi:hypothetical protein